MFWEVWRNVLGSGSSSKKDRTKSKSTKKSRYDRLISTPSPGGPKKSISQPANLTQFTDLYDDDDDDNDNLNSNQIFTKTLKPAASHLAPSDISDNNKQIGSSGGVVSCKSGGGVKRSFSSFLPFSSCSLYGSSSVVKSPISAEDQKLQLADNSKEEKAKEVVTPSESSTTAETIENYSRDQNQTPVKSVKECTNQFGLGKDEIIDYWDGNIELPTCEVCGRAFPTIRQLAAHQRRKRHYGCIECDSIFPSREVLECHREQMCHYEFAVDMYNIDEGDLNDEDDFFESEEEDENVRMWDEEEDCDDEEMERLL